MQGNQILVRSVVRLGTEFALISVHQPCNTERAFFLTFCTGLEIGSWACGCLLFLRQKARHLPNTLLCAIYAATSLSYVDPYVGACTDVLGRSPWNGACVCSRAAMRCKLRNPRRLVREECHGEKSWSVEYDSVYKSWDRFHLCLKKMIATRRNAPSCHVSVRLRCTTGYGDLVASRCNAEELTVCGCVVTSWAFWSSVWDQYGFFCVSRT
jgi:hypothetical protein